MAQWRLDSAGQIPNDFLVDAARAANPRRPDLGPRSPSVRSGPARPRRGAAGGAPAIRKRFAVAEDVLADFGPRFGTQHEAIEYLQQRTAVLYSGVKRYARGAIRQFA
jgi:hypothetical protein